MQAIAERRRSRKASFWVGTAAILICEISIFIFAGCGIAARHGESTDPGWKCRLDLPYWVVKEADQHGPASDLRPGDQVINANGMEPGWLGPAFDLMSLRAGQFYTLIIRRDTKTISKHLRMDRDRSASLSGDLETLLFASLFSVAGLVIRLAGQKDVTARLGNIAFFLGGISMIGPILVAYPGWSQSSVWLAVALARLPRPLQMSFGWDFVSRFPHSVPDQWPIRVFRRAAYAAAIGLWVLFNLPVFGQLTHLTYPPALETLQWLGRDGPFPAAANSVFDSIVGAAGFFVLVRNYRLLRDWDSRRRLRWVAVFFGIAAISLVCLRSLQLAAGVIGSETLETAQQLAEAATTVAMGMIPVALVYAFLRHRVLGIRLVIRLGLQYLLAKNVMRVVLLTPALLVLVRIARSPNQSLLDLLLHSSWHFYVPVMLTAALSLRYRREMELWLDRRFFRVAIQNEALLAAMTESIRTAATESEVAQAAEQQIQRAFAVGSIRIFLRSALSGELESTLPDAGIDSQALELALEQYRVSESRKNLSLKTPQTIYDLVPQDDSFDQPGWKLVVPLIGTDEKTFGVFLLGPRKSEQEFMRKDLELVRAIGAQVVMACEMLRLKRTVQQADKQRVAVLGRLERESIRLLQECPRCGECYDTLESTCRNDGSALQLTLPVERLVVGRYRLDRRIGSGGMGFVYDALDTRLEKPVAVKIMGAELFGKPEALMRFAREAHAVASLHHRNIVGVHDFGQLPAGGAFIVMDLLRGTPWKNHLRLKVALAPERVAGWVEGLCEGMAAAHRSGIVHRDLKPANVMISEGEDGETAMILDFGLAKHRPGFELGDVDRRVDDLSVIGTILGTPSYMSPEQRAGQTAGAASDVFSIAVMTLETLARVSPPKAGATPQWIAQALERIVKPGSKLKTLFVRALLDAPDQRITPVDDFGHLLGAAIRSEQPVALSFGIPGYDETETKSFGATN